VDALKALAEWLPISHSFPPFIRMLGVVWVALTAVLAVAVPYYRSTHKPDERVSVSVDARNAQGTAVLAAGRDLVVNGNVYAGQTPPTPVTVPNPPPDDPEKQELVALLRTNLATDRCTVTEQKMLADARTGVVREIPVVMECHLDDVPVIASFEIAPGKEPADIGWVEQMVSKHHGLPTTNLFLVSWTGFTEAALRLARATANVQLVTPELLRDAASPECRKLVIDHVALSPRKVITLVTLPGGGEKEVVLADDTAFFSPAGAEVGVAVQLVQALISRPDVIKGVMLEAHNRRQEDLRSFVVGFPAEDLRAHFGEDVSLREERTGEFHRIVAIEIVGDFSLAQVPLTFAISKFGDVKFAHAKTHIAGNDATFVAKVEEKNSVTRMTVRLRPPPSNVKSGN
jgi:hypothetical protein